MPFWIAVTDFGDSAAMVPAAIVIILWLALGGAWHRARLWLIAFSAAVALVATSKMAFLGWGIGIAALDFTGISGHAMLSTAILSVGCSLAAERAPVAARWLAGLAGFAAGILIGFSRLELAVHSVSEVVAGIALGAAVALGFTRLGRHMTAPAIRPQYGMAVLVLLLVAIHGEIAPSQDILTRISLALSGRATPFTRTLWQPAATGRPVISSLAVTPALAAPPP